MNVGVVDVDVDVECCVGSEVGVGECEGSLFGIFKEGDGVDIVGVAGEEFHVVDFSLGVDEGQ